MRELETLNGITIQQRKYFRVQDTFYLPSSMTNCKDYSLGEDSYMKCLVKSYVNTFESIAKANDLGCKCVPNSTYKSFFEIQPTSLDWDECKNQSEHIKCSAVIIPRIGGGG